MQAITQLPTPTCTKDLTSVLGMVNFVRRFIEDYAEITAPLVRLTGKYFVLKNALKTLGVPNKILPLRV